MKKILSIILLVVSASGIYSQNLAHTWSRSLSGASDVETVATRIDPNGDVITVGMFTGTIDLDPSAATATYTSNGLKDIFIAKYSAAGSFIYANTFGGTGNEEVKDLLVDGYQFYLVGNFEGTVNFGTGNKISNGLRDVFINKYTSGGTSFLTVWSQTFGGIGDDVGNAIVRSVVVLTDAIWVTGGFSNTVDFNPGVGVDSKNSNGFTDIYITRFDLNGNYIAVTHHGGTSYDMGNDIATNLADVFVTGHFTGTVDFGYSGSPINLTSAGNQDAFVSRYATASGLTTWAKAMGGPLTDNGISIGIDNSFNIYSTGTFQGTADFDPSINTANLTSAGGTDVFVSKLLITGAYSWSKKIGGTSSDTPTDIFVEGTGHHFVTGSFIGTANFMPASTNTIVATGAKDIFIAKYNSGGGYLFANSIGGSGDDEARSLFVSNTNHIYLSGSYRNTVDFDITAATSTLSATGTTADGFIAKYYPCAAFVLTATSSGTLCAGQSFSLTAPAGLSSYAWSGPNSFTASVQTPSVNNSTPSMSGTYSLTGIDANGCSAATTTTISVITNTNTTASVVTQTICAGSNFVLNASGGNTYLWSGPNSYTSAVQSPTISNSTPGMSGIYTVTATPTGGCQGTSTVNITVNNLPATTASNTGPFCAGSTATLNASGAATYTWVAPVAAGSFTSSAQNFTFTINVGGVYSVFGTSAAGCVSSATTNVVAITMPNPTTAGNSGPYCIGNTIALNATGGGTYAWTGPLSYTSALQNPSIPNANTSQSGIYTVTATFNGCSKTATTNVSVNSNTAAVASVSSNTICEGSNFSLNAGGGVSYSWAGPNTYTSTSQNPVFTNATTSLSGIYTVTAVNASACVGTATLNLIINTKPSVTASGPSGTVCAGGDIQLNASGANTYSWSGPNFYNAFVQNPLINFVNSSFGGTYTVTGTNAAGCSGTATTSVFVSNLFLNNTVNTNGNVLMASESGATSYQWVDCNNNNTPVAGQTSQSFTVTVSGNYAVIITKNSCSVMSPCNQITINTCTLSNNVTQNANTLTATQTGAAYQWVDCNNGNAPIPGATAQAFTPTVTGNYAATISSGTCVVTSACTHVNINVTPTGLNKSLLLNDITLQPNPASTFFTLSHIVAGTTLNIFDISGKIIYSEKTELSETSIDTSHLSDGLYVIQFQYNGAVIHKKIVISK